MLTHLLIVVLASASLALGEEQQQQNQTVLAFECCDRDKVVPVMFRDIPYGCFGMIKDVTFENGEFKETSKGCPFHECVMRKRQYLKANGTLHMSSTINKVFSETKKEFKPIVDKALGICARKYVKNVNEFKREGCNSGADVFFRCVTDEIRRNCPKEFWLTKTNERPQCPEKI